MSTLSSYRLQNRRIGPQKTCADCGETIPANLTFCPNCGQDVRDVPENVRTVSESRTQFQIPAFLLAGPDGRRFDEEGVGTGIIWVGLALLAIPAVTRNLSPLSIGAWVVGCILTGVGIARTRRDGQSMLRAGALTAAAGVLTLAVLGNQIYRHQSVPADLDQQRASVAETPSVENETTESSLAMVLTGSNPMFRGAPAHSGVLAGPALEGNPYRAWRYDAGSDLRSTPAISGAVAYFGTNDGYLIALDMLTQKPKWSFDLGGYPVRASPAIADRTVYLANGFSVFAIDADTGNQRWKFAMDYAGESSPTVTDGVVYVASKENHLYAIDTKTGKQLWFYKTDGLLFGSPSVSGDKVVIGGDDGDLFAVDRTNGHLAWKIALDSGIYSTPAIDGERVYVTTKNKTTVAVDLASGDEIWSYPVGGSASPAVADGVVYIGSDDGAIYAIDAAKGGDPLWLFATGGAAVRSPIVAGDEVVFATGATVTSLNRETGEVVWQYPVGDDVTTEPVVLDGYLYVGDKNGYFYAITGDASLATPSNPGNGGHSGGKPSNT
ncbi:MAG TPA: PQQ-binding-like beta-propeller repeat protein [Thermomicrobiales bacterium]|nr:PQQ-binding-like beta-propeller repeat protein [Thermomicrobiales bacterium]